MQIRFTLRCILYVATSVCKNLYHTEVQSVVLQRHGQQPVSFLVSGIQKFVDRGQCLSELGRYVET